MDINQYHQLMDKYRTILHDTQIDEKNPGPILQYFGMLLTYIGDKGIPVTKSNQYFTAKTLKELDWMLGNPLRLKINRPKQPQYPHIHGLYKLLRGSGISYVDSQQSTPRLKLDDFTIASWNELNDVEKYFTLLETLFFRVKTNPIMGFDFSNKLTLQDLLVVMQEIPAEGLHIKSDSELIEDLEEFPGLHILTLMEMFGLISIEESNKNTDTEWNIETIARTGFGEAIMVIYPGNVMKIQTMTQFQGNNLKESTVTWLTMSEYFPEYQTILKKIPSEFKDGVYRYKVSIGKTWRTLEISAHMTFELFAFSILDAFEFDWDHLFQFEFQNRLGEIMHIVHPAIQEDGISADEIKIGEILQRPGTKLLFKYDFGDNWEFEVKLESIDEKAPKLKKTRIVESVGEAPNQYPAWDDYDDYDEDDEDEDYDDDQYDDEED